MMPEAPEGLLAMVPKLSGDAQDTTQHGPENSISREAERVVYTHFGEYLVLKQECTLHIGFQNIGGIPAIKKS
jgi:hypothetical protein